MLSSGKSKQIEELIETGGKRLWFETYKSPITLEGRTIGTVGFSREITKYKQTEAALTTALAEAEKANHDKSRFLAAASHDLRQPLLALSLYIEVLKNQVLPANSDLVDNIQICIANLSELLNDLLDVSKLEAGVVNPHSSNFAIDNLLAELVSVQEGEATLKGLRLRHRRSGVIARADRTLMTRIIGNLLVNAIRYTNRGGVLIACRRYQGKQWVEVWDTGIGIPDDKIETIFEEYRQLGDYSKNRGSGLGLAIVAKTAKLLGLQIRLRSRLGYGSMFAIELPVGAMAEPTQRGVEPLIATPLRIAFVDDNVSILDAFFMALTSYGHQVVVASSATELLGRLDGKAPDVLISDYRLAAGETGFDVILAVRKVFGETLPALLITGDTDPTLIRSMADCGVAVQYKPLKMEALQEFFMEVAKQRHP